MLVAGEASFDEAKLRWYRGFFIRPLLLQTAVFFVHYRKIPVMIYFIFEGRFLDEVLLNG